MTQDTNTTNTAISSLSAGRRHGAAMKPEDIKNLIGRIQNPQDIDVNMESARQLLTLPFEVSAPYFTKRQTVDSLKTYVRSLEAQCEDEPNDKEQESKSDITGTQSSHSKGTKSGKSKGKKPKQKDHKRGKEHKDRSRKRKTRDHEKKGKDHKKSKEKSKEKVEEKVEEKSKKKSTTKKKKKKAPPTHDHDNINLEEAPYDGIVTKIWRKEKELRPFIGTSKLSNVNQQHFRSPDQRADYEKVQRLLTKDYCAKQQYPGYFDDGRFFRFKQGDDSHDLDSDLTGSDQKTGEDQKEDDVPSGPPPAKKRKGNLPDPE